jgi:membrane protein DedA with SNARE-associated domain
MPDASLIPRVCSRSASTVALFGTKSHMLLYADLPRLLATYGYLIVGGVVAVESMGLPLPGEAVLIAAAVYAGETHHLNIWLVIIAAAAGAILGDNLGFWIGREVGYRLLLRYGPYVGLTEGRIKLGQYLFNQHGGKIVFFGRFVAVLRVLAALLAGVNQMSWTRFLLFNATGGVLWASVYGLAAYYFGHKLERLATPAAFGITFFAVVIIGVSWIIVRRHESDLQQAAERALPGPLKAPRRKARSSGGG